MYLYLTPLFGVNLRAVLGQIWLQKTRIIILSRGAQAAQRISIFDIGLLNRVGVDHQCDRRTDSQTDGQTDRITIAIACACITTHAISCSRSYIRLCNAVMLSAVLTHSAPAVPNCCCSKGSTPYWSNPLFLIFDIRALWRSVLSAKAPECQKLKIAG